MLWNHDVPLASMCVTVRVDHISQSHFSVVSDLQWNGMMDALEYEICNGGVACEKVSS